MTTQMAFERLEDEEDLKALRKAKAEDDGYRISFANIMEKYAE